MSRGCCGLRLTGLRSRLDVTRKKLLPNKREAALLFGLLDYLMISISRERTTKTVAAILVPSASLASKVLDLDLLK